jgi:hypothetical protein
MAVDAALRDGNRGLPGGSSLTILLARHRRVRNPKALPRLTQRLVLAWIDAHHKRTGQWKLSGSFLRSDKHTLTGLSSEEFSC